MNHRKIFYTTKEKEEAFKRNEKKEELEREIEESKRKISSNSQQPNSQQPNSQRYESDDFRTLLSQTFSMYYRSATNYFLSPRLLNFLTYFK